MWNYQKNISSNFQTILYKNNFYNGKDILQIILRSEFESINSDLIGRLKEPIKNTLFDTILIKNEINEVKEILVENPDSSIKNCFNVNSLGLFNFINMGEL